MSICLELFHLPRSERRIEEVKKRAGSEWGKVYLDLQRRKKKERERKRLLTERVDVRLPSARGEDKG